MRTTINLDADAVKAIRALSRERDIPLGAAASELIRRGIRYEVGTKVVNGIPVFDAPAEFPTITTRQVREILSEE
jgi:hypothetical protein